VNVSSRLVDKCEWLLVVRFYSTLQLKYKIMNKENNWIGKGNTGSHTTISI